MAKSIDSQQVQRRGGWSSVVSRRYISIAEAAEYRGISTKFVRNLIAEGELNGYRIGSYVRHRTLRVDLDEIDDKLIRPVGPYWKLPTVSPRKRTNNRSVPDRLTAWPGSIHSTRRTTASARVVTARSAITDPTVWGRVALRRG